MSVQVVRMEAKADGSYEVESVAETQQSEDSSKSVVGASSKAMQKQPWKRTQKRRRTQKIWEIM